MSNSIRSLPSRRWLFPFLLLLITLVAFVLGSSQKLVAFSSAVHDDRLFVNLATRIVNHGWLGKYDQFTLIKGPFYPIFLAVNHILGIPSLITQRLLYYFSGLMLVYALSFLLRSRLLLLLIYTIYVFNPVTYSITRVVRDTIYPSLTTLTLALALLVTIHLAQNQRGRIVTFHSSAFGFCFACFWLTREEGLWLVPCIALILIGGAVGLVRQSGQPRLVLRQIIRLLLPSGLGYFGLIFCVMLINFDSYGVFLARPEVVSREFNDAYGALLRVKETHWNPYLPVPREVREQLYATSKNFRQLQSYLTNREVVEGWGGAKSDGCRLYPSTCGDYAGGWFIWVFRDAVSAAGYHRNAPQALSYYRELAQEINSLCEQKRLDCEPHKTGMIPSLNGYYLRQLPTTFSRGMFAAFSLAELSILKSLTPSAGDEAGISLFKELTHDAVNALDSTNGELKGLKVTGWINATDYEVKLFNESEGYLEESRRLPSPDLVAAFSNPELDRSRFSLLVKCKACEISILKSGREAIRINLLTGTATTISLPALKYNIEHSKPQEPEQVNIPNVPKIKLAILEFINIVLYRHLLLYLNGLALLLWIFRLTIFRLLPLTTIYYIATCFLTAVVIRILVLSLVDVTSFPALDYVYLAPSIPLLHVFTSLVISDTVIILNHRRKSMNVKIS